MSRSADCNGALNDSTEIEVLSSGSVGALSKDNRSDYKIQAKAEPVFLEVIPEDLVTIHPDQSQTVGLFDGQQPLHVVEQAQREVDVEPAKAWGWWPSGLQENQIKIKPDVQGKYGREMAAAVQAVQLACMLSQRVQERLLRHEEKAGSKKDKSLITVAGTLYFLYLAFMKVYIPISECHTLQFSSDLVKDFKFSRFSRRPIIIDIFVPFHSTLYEEFMCVW